MSDLLGFRYLARLLQSPGRAFAAAFLRGLSAPAAEAAPGRGDEMMDSEARRSVRARLEDLDHLIGEAERNGDLGAAALCEERQTLAAELAAAEGLGGRPRRIGDGTKGARTSVSNAIARAIEAISEFHAALGRHLDLSVKTGRILRYEPEGPVRWDV